MRVRDFADIIERWAPHWTAWERDNVGLQVGDRNWEVSRILLALDVTPSVVEQAVKNKTDLILSHHPLLFHAARSITADREPGSMLLQLLENRIAVFSAHTNLDFTEGGVSFALAERLGLQNIRFLSPLKDMMVKLAVFVPPIHVEKVSEAMARAGAGIIGQYSHCSFRLRGTGAFRGSTSTNPFIGRAGQLETVEEVRLEMISPRGRLSEIIEAMKQAHPYEEVAYDVYPLINESPNYGMGAVGELKSTTTLRQFLAMAKKRLRAQFVRYCGSLGKRIHRVAVCGGSGSDMLGDALHAKADAFVTADVRYHTFHDAHEDIALIDAGHWETEHVILKPLAEQLRTVIRQKKAKVEIQIKYSTNPIHSF